MRSVGGEGEEKQKNEGKGSAVQNGIMNSRGDYVLIQDGDLEYDPVDLNKLIKIMISKNLNVVYGSRVLKKGRYNRNEFLSNFRIFGNHALTLISNLINKQNLTDAHTCYKVFKSDIFLKLNLQENDFSFCPEVNTKISLINQKIKEVPITYKGRSVKEGKKIRFYDAVLALMTILKYKYFLKI